MCSMALSVFMVGMKIEVPGTNLLQSITIRTPSGDISAMFIRVIFSPRHFYNTLEG